MKDGTEPREVPSLLINGDEPPGKMKVKIPRDTKGTAPREVPLLPADRDTPPGKTKVKTSTKTTEPEIYSKVAEYRSELSENFCTLTRLIDEISESFQDQDVDIDQLVLEFFLINEICRRLEQYSFLTLNALDGNMRNALESYLKDKIDNYK